MESVTMPLPTAITKTRANELADELGVMWERLSKIAREMDEHGEYETNTRIKRAAGAVWGARKAIQTRAATAKDALDMYEIEELQRENNARQTREKRHKNSGLGDYVDDDDIDPRNSYRNE